MFAAAAIGTWIVLFCRLTLMSPSWDAAPPVPGVTVA
jgi:hypothetical protein